MNPTVKALTKPRTWEDFLKTLTYKPNFRFHYQYHRDIDTHLLYIEVKTEDTYHPGTELLVRFRYILPCDYQDIDLKDAQNILRQFIHQVEKHEADEWLRFNGEMIFNPHADDV